MGISKVSRTGLVKSGAFDAHVTDGFNDHNTIPKALQKEHIPKLICVNKTSVFTKVSSSNQVLNVSLRLGFFWTNTKKVESLSDPYKTILRHLPKLLWLLGGTVKQCLLLSRPQSFLFALTCIIAAELNGNKANEECRSGSESASQLKKAARTQKLTGRRMPIGRPWHGLRKQNLYSKHTELYGQMDKTMENNQWKVELNTR